MRPRASKLKVRGRSFRLLAFQPMSLELESTGPFTVSIQGICCVIALRPAHSDASSRFTYGGTYVCTDFTLDKETDFLVGARKGLDLIEDFFSAMSLVVGIPLGDVDPIEIICTDKAATNKYHLMLFLQMSQQHWPVLVSLDSIHTAGSLLAHWDGLDCGKRLRRAARQYRKAIGTARDVEAFKAAYTGLEALEKPLAEILNIPHGSEVVEGQCDMCGAKYQRKRSALAGVRAYVCGAIHPDMATAIRAEEWKKISALRNELVHNLDDTERLEQKGHELVAPAMRYLHDGICCLSHAHELESSTYRLARAMMPLVFVGMFMSDGLPPIERSEPLVEAKANKWVPHPEYGMVPQIKFRSRGCDDLEGIFCWSKAPVRLATTDDLVPANFEGCEKQDS